jgi:hypothetical protein
MSHYIAYFFGGVFFANAVPHLVEGMSGRAFPTPFASLRRRAESSSRTNVLWGAFSLAVSYVVLFHVGEFNVRSPIHVGAWAAGAFLLAYGLAASFSQHYGGDKPRKEIPLATERESGS